MHIPTATTSLNPRLLHKVPKQMQAVTTKGNKNCTSKSVKVNCRVMEAIPQNTVIIKNELQGNQMPSSSLFCGSL